MIAGWKVKIEVPDGAFLLTTAWWPKSGATGTIQKMFANGKVAVAVDQLRNRSADGRKTMNLPLAWLRAA